MSKIQFTEMKIGPRLASKFLRSNSDDNRKLSNPTVKKYARDMTMNRWDLTAEPIMVTQCGELINGQHRLQAVVLSGKTVKFTLATVPDSSTFRVLDQGRARKNTDILGTSNTVLVPLNMFLRGVLNITAPTAHDLEIARQTDLGATLFEIDSLVKPSGKLWKNSGVRAACAAAIVSGVVTKEEAFEAYRTISRKPIAEWPPLFVAMYQFVSETPSKQHLSHQRCFANEYFCRAYYCFANVNTSKTKLRISAKFMSELREKVTAVVRDAMPSKALA